VNDMRAAQDLLESSEGLRADLLTAVAKLDGYIEQLKAAMPNKSGEPHEPPSTT